MKSGSVEAIYPLSPQQQGMLFESLYRPEAAVHFEQNTCVLQGPLNITAFERAWLALMDRHEALRTCFVWKQQDQPLQVVLRRVNVPFEAYDLRKLSPSDAKKRVSDHLNADRRRGFQLARAPLMRVALFQFEEELQQVVWTVHHILMDGWCLPVLLKEVLTFYDAISRGSELHLDKPRPYRDYIAWLQRKELTQAEAFWRKELENFSEPTPLGLPVGCTTSSRPEDSNEVQIVLPDPVAQVLKASAGAHGVTLNTLIQAGWVLLLSRYSGNADVVFGTTVSGRPLGLAGVESMIGLFINTLPMRVAVKAESSCRSWLQEIQDKHLKAREFEYCSAGQIRRWSEVPASLPLYESMLVYENYPASLDDIKSLGLPIKVTDISSWGARTTCPLTLLVVPGHELVLRLIYDCSRFQELDVQRILDHLSSLLRGITQNPDTDVRQLLQRIPADEIPTTDSFSHTH